LKENLKTFRIYNENTGSSLAPDALQVSWRKLKIKAKSEVSQHKASVRATGGGPPTAAPSADTEKVLSIIGHSGKNMISLN